MRGVKNLAIPALLVLGVVSGCSGDDEAKSGATTATTGADSIVAKSEVVPAGQRRILELEGGVRVEILAEGNGDVVGPGDEVALSMTMSFVPPPAAEKVEEPKVDGAAADESKSKSEKKKPKSSSAKSKGAKPTEDAATKKGAAATEGATDASSKGKETEAAKAGDATPETTPPEVVPADAKDSQPHANPVVVPHEAPTEVESAKSGEVTAPNTAPNTTPTGAAETEPAASASPADASPADASPADASPAGASPAGPTTPPESVEKPPESVPPANADAPANATPAAQPEGTAPAPVPLAAPLEPVIVVSTKDLGTPIRARVGASSTLLPGLSRALVGLRQGTIAEITLPAEAAYGAAGLPAAGIPPGTPLLATIEIREVKR
jgi:hypothetical protein